MLNWKTGLKLVIAASVLAGSGTAAYAYYSQSASAGVIMPDLTGVTEQDIVQWTKKYDINNQIKIVYKYSEEDEKSVVIDQSIKTGKIMHDEDTLKLTVSLGPDMEKKFKLPDFKDKAKSDIEAWFNENHFTSVTYTYEAVEDPALETDSFISMEPGAGTEVVHTAEIKIKLVSNEISVPDLVTMNKDEIQAWGDKWSITIKFEEEESKMLNDGAILSVSAAKDSKVKRGDVITVKVAKHVESQEAVSEEKHNQQTDTNYEAPAGSTAGSSTQQNQPESQPQQNQQSGGSSQPIQPQAPAPTPDMHACDDFFFLPNQSFGSTAEAKDKLSSAANQAGCPIIFYETTDIRGDFQIVNKGDHVDAYIKIY